ncbi:MAG: methyltransferase domain-containing protein [Stappiaceae bacterium]
MDRGNAPFDRRLLALRRARALRTRTPEADFLLKAVLQDLAERLNAVNRRFERALDLGGHTGRTSEMLLRSEKVDHIVRTDVQTGDLHGKYPALVADEETLPFAEESFDLIVSALILQWTNDLPGTLLQIRKCLKPDGLFLGVLPGGETLNELREAFLMAEAELTGGISPRVAPFSTTQGIGALLQRARFALPVVDQDKLIVRYDTAFHLMRDLKSMGATNVMHERSRKPPSRALFIKMAENYMRLFSDKDGRIRATFQMISMSGWAPHESQQKPLKPGSAKTSLAEALANPGSIEPERDG